MNFITIIFCLILPSLGADAQTISRRRGPPLHDKPSIKATKFPESHTITQLLDHFNPTDLRTWSMRYISNDQFFRNGGPILIYLGGEWEISGGALMNGAIFDLAERHNGYMFYTEHRYYGFSYPTENMTTENLKYLSTDQALADIVYFVKHIKENIHGLANSKVVVVGCSYAGSLATWIRLKYPHVIDAAYASSGPVRAVDDFQEFLEVVDEQIGQVSQDCLHTFSEGMRQLEEKLESDEGIAEMTKRLRMCEPIKDVEPYRSHLFCEYITKVVKDRVQYAKSREQIKFVCKIFEAPKGTALDKLIAFTNRQSGSEHTCLPGYGEYIRRYGASNNTNILIRPWTYQTCTEYGYFETTTSDKQRFGKTCPVDYYIQLCADLFGKHMTPEILHNGINRTNLVYGSLTPEITKVVSVHGSLDPWHVLGIQHDLNPLAPLILINGTGHCQDLGSIDPAIDSDELIAAKRKAQDLISKWIQ